MKALTVFNAFASIGAAANGPVTMMTRSLPRLLAAIGGAALRQRPLLDQFSDFMAVPSDVPWQGAMTIVEALAAARLLLLDSEQRNALARQISKVAQDTAFDVVIALRRAPEVQQATGQSADHLDLMMQQEMALISVQTGMGLALDGVNDARLELQACQFAAQQRIIAALCQELLAADSPEHRIAMVADAGPLLDLLEQRLLALRAARKQATATRAALAAEQERLDNELLVVQTLRALRDHQPVDDAVLRRAALYYQSQRP